MVLLTRSHTAAMAAVDMFQISVIQIKSIFYNHLLMLLVWEEFLLEDKLHIIIIVRDPFLIMFVRSGVVKIL